MKKYDTIVVGGGPGGCAAAFYNAKAGKRVLLIEKSKFPRDKVCGDGITGKALTLLHDMGLGDELTDIKEISSKGVVIVAPNEVSLNIPIHSYDDPLSAFSLDRIILDEVVFNHACKEVLSNGGEVLHDKVTGVIEKAGVVTGVKTNTGDYFSDVVVGAGGYNCPVSRYVLTNNNVPKQDRKHYSSAVREYWQGLEGNSGDFEIHFIKGVMPGYFWIFPISETRFNIGVGMLLSDMDDQKVKLKKMLDYIVNESYLKGRFANATPVPNTQKGWLLPLGSPRGSGLQPRKNFVNGCVLVGDAASLIDPFTGEGIGNALVSGKLTAEYDVIDDKSGEHYQNQLWGMIGGELSNSHRLQKMLKREWLINRFIKKAKKSPKLQSIITDMLHNKDSQDSFNSTWFLIKSLIF
jgi:geranylgeranyl reductase family protein